MKKYFILFVLSTFCSIINAQINDTVYVQRNDNGHIIFARFQTSGQNLYTLNDTAFLKSVFNATANDKFVKIKENTDDLGITHKRFQQYYKGFKVESAQYLTHSRNGNIEYINGDFQNISLSSISLTFPQ
jgi:Zn-dependent metalloprotease